MFKFTSQLQEVSLLHTRKISKTNQYLWSIGSVLITALACYFGAYYIGYRTVALLLLVSVSVSAMLFDIYPVLSSAVLSALIWNYFFIPPTGTFHIDNTEDLLMFLMYFLIASVNAVLSVKIRKQEAKARDKEEKENTIKLYNTLLNSLSHELRTPIATIIGSVDALTEHKGKISEQNQTELLNQISIASLRLNTHVENLLNMSRLETGTLKLNVDWCDINELIHYVIQNISIPYTQKIIFNPIESLPYFKFDRGLIEQVLQNLVNNAICHTPSNTQIQISANLEDDKCVIVISDNGDGLTLEELENLFEKFYRGVESKTGGLGIGLSIVKGFVEAHKGHVSVNNNSKGGLSFVVSIEAEQSYVNSLKNE